MNWQDFSPEDRLILCCARREMDRYCRMEMETVLEKGLEWDDVMKSGGRQGVLSFVYYHLKEMEGIEVPLWVMGKLKDVSYRIIYRNMRIYNLLRRILKRFEERGIAVILLKGVALAEKVYGNIGLRPMYDIDILIKREDVEPVENLMAELSCLPNHETEEGKSYHYHYLDRDTRIGIEVHWDIENIPNPFSLDITEIWERAQQKGISDTQALFFSPEDLILYLCLHSAYHHKFSKHLITLKQICDISETIRCYRTEIDWSRLQSLAQRYGLSKLSYCTLYMTELLLKTGIPLEKLEDMKFESFNEEHIDFIIKERIFAQDIFPTGIVRSLSNSSTSDKVKAMVTTIFPPLADIARRYSVSFLSPKVYLYYLMRVFRLLFDYSGISLKLLTRNQQTISQLEKEIEVSKRQPEIDQWLESLA